MKYFIYGTTDLAENLLYLLEEENYTLEGFVLDNQYLTEEKKVIDLGYIKKEYTIYDFDILDQLFDKKEIAIFVCIGYTHMNAERKRKMQQICKKGFSLPNFISKKACVEAVNIGVGNLFFEDSYVGMYDNIGDGNIFYARSMVAHHSDVGSFNFFAISSSVAAHVKIGDENFFGNNSMTKEKISIGDRNLVGAGAYVFSSISNDNVIVPSESKIINGKKGIDFF